MISAFAGFQQSANISALQPSKDVGSSTKDSAAPGARNVLTAMQASDEGARQAFDKASTQIVTSFLDGLQNKISDEPVKGGNDAGSLTSLTSAEFINTLSVSSNNSNEIAGGPEDRRPGGRPEGPPPGSGPPPNGGPPPTGGEGSGDLELDSALELMEAIAEDALEEDEDAIDETYVDLTTSLFADSHYTTY